MKFTLLVLFLTAWLYHSVAQNTEPPSMAAFMGANTNVAAYDNGYLSDLSKGVKWIREYHSWAHYEAANDFFKWDNITKTPHTYTWPDHNKFMDACRELGIEVLIDVLNKPQWAGSSPVPNTSGDGSQAADYLEKLEFIGQLVARYGSKKIDESLLKTADKVSGLNYIRYFEDDNEPDYWWESPRWPPEHYAAYCNAVHDGYGVEPDENYPLLGIKSVDPDARHVLAGMALRDTAYLHRLMEASGGRTPFDVLNVHIYCTDRNKGYSPENEKFGFEKGFEDFFKWKNRRLPHLPVWITEFGWDTYLAPNNQHSYIWAPYEQQANYLMRSWFILMKMGFEKAFMFMAADGNSQNVLQYSSSGFFKDKNNNFEKKISWYYQTTLQNVLGKAKLKEIPMYAEPEGENELFAFHFVNPETAEQIYVLWTRKTGSDTDTGASANVWFDVGFSPKEAYAILPKHLKENGDTIAVNAEENRVKLELTETPLFLIIPKTSTGYGKTFRKIHPVMQVFPNPSKESVTVSIEYHDPQPVHLSVYSAGGILVKNILNGVNINGLWKSDIAVDFKPGIYFLNLRAGNSKYNQKLIISK